MGGTEAKRTEGGYKCLDADANLQRKLCLKKKCRESNREYWRKNKEKIKAKKAEHRRENKEKIKVKREEERKKRIENEQKEIAKQQQLKREGYKIEPK